MGLQSLAECGQQLSKCDIPKAGHSTHVLQQQGRHGWPTKKCVDTRQYRTVMQCKSARSKPFSTGLKQLAEDSETGIVHPPALSPWLIMMMMMNMMYEWKCVSVLTVLSLTAEGDTTSTSQADVTLVLDCSDRLRTCCFDSMAAAAAAACCSCNSWCRLPQAEYTSSTFFWTFSTKLYQHMQTSRLTSITTELSK